MKKLVYLICAHKNVEQLNNLISLVSDDYAEVFVNVDLKSTINIKEINSKAKVIKKRIPIIWSDSSLLVAILNSIVEIDSCNFDYTHVIFISGQDYPVKTNAEIMRTLDAELDYIAYREISDSGLKWQTRYTEYHYHGNSPIIRRIIRFANRLYKKLKIERKMPYNLKPYGGSAWWILSKSTIQYILNYTRNHKKLLRFYKYVNFSDEIYFHTILCNSELKSKLKNGNLRFIKWLSSYHASPEILDLSFYDEIIQSNCIFCRKIESPKSDSLISQLSKRRNLIE